MSNQKSDNLIAVSWFVRQQSCNRKRSFTEHEAKQVLGRMRKQTKHHDLEHYWCEECGGYHIGHRPKFKRPSKVERRQHGYTIRRLIATLCQIQAQKTS